jgi:hypothetical protein
VGLEMVSIKCCWKDCEEEADDEITKLCPWGPFMYCPKHDKEMHDQLIKYFEDHKEDEKE